MSPGGRLDLRARWIHAAIPLLLIGVEMCYFGSRSLTIEKMWGGIYGAGLVTLIPLVLVQRNLIFRFFSVFLVLIFAICLGVWMNIRYSELDRARHASDLRAALGESQDDDAIVTRIETLDGRRLGAGPILVAERDGEIVAALSLADSATVGDPFRFTLDAVTALRRAAAESRVDDHRSAGPRLHRRALAVLGLAAVISAGLLATAGQAAPKPAFSEGTWVGTGSGTAVPRVRRGCRSPSGGRMTTVEPCIT